MKTHLRTTLLLTAALVASFAAGCSPKSASTPSTPAASAAAATYPLRGVITELLPAQSELMVKHEDIPGFMPAMTMLFKVDAATFKAAAKGQTIAATLYKQGDDFWLRDVHPTAAKK
jgi:protein SCO1/2